MSGFMPVNPRPMLLALVGKDIRVRLKWGYTEYTGTLISADSYMNLQLANTEEFIDGKSTGTLGQVLFRCNNVLWISAKDAGEPGKSNDAEMSEEKAGKKLLTAAPDETGRRQQRNVIKEDPGDGKACSSTGGTAGTMRSGDGPRSRDAASLTPPSDMTTIPKRKRDDGEAEEEPVSDPKRAKVEKE
ncbi:putative small nuclear ribonucleoprotein F [Lasiodiplodia hormozganensis]|uniref:Sm protein F n=1 Tax=Lasiodiplodia hormozganensis TaxID=869390 RepID=A0AA40CJ51_9PEZI|nr:putative small nuclear ribonucleoprotein F [Lasiodiplodia hormozganensis]